MGLPVVLQLTFLKKYLGSYGKHVNTTLHACCNFKYSTIASLTHKRQRPDSDDDEIDASTIFKIQDIFARFLIIELTMISQLHLNLPLLLRNKKKCLLVRQVGEQDLKKPTLLVETTRKIKTEHLLK